MATGSVLRVNMPASKTQQQQQPVSMVPCAGGTSRSQTLRGGTAAEAAPAPTPTSTLATAPFQHSGSGSGSGARAQASELSEVACFLNI